MSPVGFEPTIAAGERPQTYALDRAATGTGEFSWLVRENNLALNYYPVSSIVWILPANGLRLQDKFTDKGQT